MQQPTLESLVALLPLARDIPSLLEDQAKQYFLMARTLLKQILLVVPHLRDLRSRTVNNLKAILEESFKDSEGICSMIKKERKKLSRFRKSDRKAELRKDDNMAYSQLLIKIIYYIKIEHSLHQLAVNHFLIIQVFPDYGFQASSRYVQGCQNFKQPAHNASGQVVIVPSHSHHLMIK